jgi:hypothetical protein
VTTAPHGYSRLLNTKTYATVMQMRSAAIEGARQRHQPAEIRLLFVGESAPAGGTFFYAENSTLYHETRAAFARALPPEITAAGRFVDLFKRLGCYLDDLCLEPVNHLPEATRRQKRSDAEESLAVRLRNHSPLMVVAVGKTTAAPHVRSVLAAPGLTEISFRVVAFPGRPEHKAMFHSEMDVILREARERDVLRGLAPTGRRGHEL